MSSIISNRLLDGKEKLLKTGVTIAVANNEHLPIQGIAKLKFSCSNNPDVKSDANFIVTMHKWDGFDGLLGNDILINLGAKVDMKEKYLECENGKVRMKLIKQNIRDLIMMPLNIGTSCESEKLSV